MGYSDIYIKILVPSDHELHPVKRTMKSIKFFTVGSISCRPLFMLRMGVRIGFYGFVKGFEDQRSIMGVPNDIGNDTLGWHTSQALFDVFLA